MTDSVDIGYFHELAANDPENVCRRALCSYDPAKRSYTLSVWGEDYRVFPQEYKITRVRDDLFDINIYLGLFIICYLLGSKEILISKEWISEKDIPGGITFFRGPHAIPTYLIEQRFSDNIGEFKKVCEQLYGIPLDMADEAYYFKIAPRVPVGVLFWQGDNEFPAESKILFDRTITEHLALDVIFGLALEICGRIGGSSSK